MASTAEKLDLELWEEAKADARDAYGGHSARAMQYASKLYKARGGRYKGRKRADNRLVQWTRQDWTTKSGRPSRETGERYLPRAAIESLSSAEYGATSRAKRRGGGVGSVVAQPPSIREKTRKFRKVNPMATPAQIAARKKFAERARSGELAKMRKKATKRNPTASKARVVKKNPITETLIYGLPQGETRDYMEQLLYDGGLKLTDAQINQVLKAASDAGYHSFRIAGFDPTMRPDFTKAIATKSRRKRNPTATRAPARSRTKLVENGDRKKNPVKRQKMGKIAWLSRGGERQVMEVPIDFSFKQYVGNIQEYFFARTENGFLIVTEKSTGFKVGQVPHTMRAAALNDRAAAKRFVESILERIGADKFRQAIKSQPKIA